MNDINLTIEYKYVNGVNGNIISKHKYSNRVFPFCVAVSVEKGTFFVETNNKRYDISEGETVFISSFIPHNVGTDGDGVVTYAHFVCSYLNVDIFNFSKIDCVVIKDDDIHKSLIQMNKSALTGGFLGKIGVDKSISDIILILLRKHILQPEYPEMDLWLYKVLNYIKQNAHQSISVDEIIALSGYSKATFYKLFTKTINLTPLQYIEQERLKKSIFVLLEGKKVKEAAKSAGYTDEIYFTKKFKSVFGVTPSQYRKNIKTNGGIIKWY